MLYDDGAIPSQPNRQKTRKNTEGIATERQRCQRQRESRERNARGRDRRRTVARPARNRTGGLRNQRVIADRPRNQTSSQKDAFFFRANPTFALDHVTVHNPQNRSQRARRRFPGVPVPCRRDPRGAGGCRRCRQHQALVATMVGMMRTTSGNVMQKHEPRRRDTGRRCLTPRIGFIPAAVRRARRR